MPRGAQITTEPLANLGLLYRKQPWRSRANCLTANPDLFFPVTDGPDAQKAKALCEACPVRNECLGLALELDERFGIWGGMTSTDREKLRKKGRRREPIVYGSR